MIEKNNEEAEKALRKELRENTFSTLKTVSFAITIMMILYVVSLIFFYFNLIFLSKITLYAEFVPLAFLMLTAISTFAYFVFDRRGISFPKNIYKGDFTKNRVIDSEIIRKFILREVINNE